MCPKIKERYAGFDRAYYTTDSYVAYEKEFMTIAENHVLASVLKQIPTEPHWTFLDVGCGLGGTILALRKRGFEAFGTDVSSYCLEHSPAKRWMQFGEASALPFPDKSFDVAICCYIMQYLTLEQAKHAIRELARVSRRYVSFWFCGAESWTWSDEMNPDDQRIGDTRNCTPEDFEAMFRSNGGVLFSAHRDLEIKEIPEWHQIYRMH